MNWKLFIGITAHKIEQAFIKSHISFINENFPFGRHWLFDIKRSINSSSSPSVIIDAGANTGSVTLELNYWFPTAIIYAFEPIKNTFNMLVKNTAGKPDIKPFQLGLGDKNENVKILLSSENTINSLKITESHQDIVGTELITITRLDSFLQSHNLTHIDILKIDVEGFEFEVLQGCNTLTNGSIKYIYLEVGYEREPTKVHFSDVEQYMEKNGYVICGIYETRRHMYDKRRLWYSNNLYIHKSLLS